MQILKPLTLLAIATLSWQNPAIATSAQRSLSSEPLEITPPAIIAQAQEQAAIGMCPAQLASRLDSIVNRPTFASARWGIHIESLQDGTVLYSRNPHQALIPASNIKLLTTAAALQLYDPRSPISSSNLGAWIHTINQSSHNGYADSLLRGIGGAPSVRDVLSRLGVETNGFRQIDGSGLSRQNLATPYALVQILRSMRSSAYGGEVFYASLPVAGVSGTLRNRMRATPAQGQVRAKTGTLQGVRALSGYLEHPEYGPVAFSILVNQPGQAGNTLIGAIDQIVLQLTQVRNCNF
ncbi:D-alanyl-D-alanine carboxypeptidase/D-alanyl-D-alanine-endopeptidase [Spirulina subsalsa]|uniref:D-alanyl-D-alanine carboxypeptidase/D-alanyl-D-alanine endopeptidase n=1 Tax=Spirulina subsalsa TaxID=54311 RepID=UPI0002F1E986|nr:D-alanyl-D-alanine carboxypeptidase/D-alanyl-D-alanine-endopeptidase [Spirulina subsalsa]